jgi:hypothetical protein
MNYEKMPPLQGWRLQEVEGLLSLRLELDDLPPEDVASQLWALHEMVIRRVIRQRESDRELARIGSSEESDPAEESDRIGSNRIEESDRIGSDEVYLTCQEIAEAVGVSLEEVTNRAFQWRLRARDQDLYNPMNLTLDYLLTLEYPVSVLPDDWRLKVSGYVSISD